jgi:L-asparaginase/Glu-tRNA(Gln) amidotransferase subunit D
MEFLDMKLSQLPRIGFLVTHGTDTMSWGLSALRYLLKNLPANVAITGSQMPMSLEFSSSDGYNNIENAIKLLTQFPGAPNVFVVFNNGQIAFHDSLWKLSKWSPNAFIGDELAKIGMDDITIQGKFHQSRMDRKLDKLILIRTGGTIESEINEEGVLAPTADVVPAYISYRFSNFYEEFSSISLMASDSSDLIFEDWKRIANKIAEQAQLMGYTTFCDTNFEEKISLIALSPFHTTDDYLASFRGKKGVLLECYGSGTINIDLKKGYSLLPAIKQATDEEKIVVLVSHAPIGTMGFIYQNAWEAIKAGAIPSGSFGIAHSQVKLAYILGHQKILEEKAKETEIDKEKLIKLAFLSGVDFQSQASRKKFEKIFGHPIPLFDPFFNLSFNAALEKIIQFIKKAEKKQVKITSIVEFEKTYNEFLVDPKMRKKWALILKPDIVIGTNNWGELVDAEKNLANLLNELLDWNVITIELSLIDYKELEKKVKEITGLTFSAFIRSFRYLIVEGGRQSVYLPESFTELADGRFEKKHFMKLLQEMLRQRTTPLSSSALLICLGHQGVIEALREQLVDIIENKSKLLKELQKEKKEVAKELDKILDDIEETGSKLVIRKRFSPKNKKGKIIVKGFNDSQFGVTKNEVPEKGLKKLVPYSTEGLKLKKEIIETYEELARYHTGIIEEYYPVERLDVVMLHNDEVNEEAILFLNWALSKITFFTEKHFSLLEQLKECQKLIGLPIGLEIIGSTLYRTTAREEKDCLTEIAGMIIYHYDPKTESVKRDYTLQFHPELFEEVRAIHKSDLQRKTLVEISDGIKILLATIQGGYIETIKTMK